MPIEETPGGLGNAGYISGKAVEREQARLAREAAARRVPSIPTGDDTECKGEGDRDSLCENCQESADSEPDAV